MRVLVLTTNNCDDCACAMGDRAKTRHWRRDGFQTNSRGCFDGIYSVFRRESTKQSRRHLHKIHAVKKIRSLAPTGRRHGSDVYYGQQTRTISRKCPSARLAAAFCGLVRFEGYVLYYSLCGLRACSNVFRSERGIIHQNLRAHPSYVPERRLSSINLVFGPKRHRHNRLEEPKLYRGCDSCLC